MNKTRKSSSNLNVATEIYFASIQTNFSYVNQKYFNRYGIYYVGLFLVLSIGNKYKTIILYKWTI